jgi:hypothetical protein
MNRIGESVHIDCHQKLSKGVTVVHPGRTYHLPGRLTVTAAWPGWRWKWSSNTATRGLTARKLTGKWNVFWRTLKEDFIEEALCEDIDDLKNELSVFGVCYNEHRPHSAGNIPPANRLNM